MTQELFSVRSKNHYHKFISEVNSYLGQPGYRLVNVTCGDDIDKAVAWIIFDNTDFGRLKEPTNDK